jgi:hypothetical protein
VNATTLLALIFNFGRVREGWARGRRKHEFRRILHALRAIKADGPWEFTATVTFKEGSRPLIRGFSS